MLCVKPSPNSSFVAVQRTEEVVSVVSPAHKQEVVLSFYNARRGNAILKNGVMWLPRYEKKTSFFNGLFQGVSPVKQTSCMLALVTLLGVEVYEVSLSNRQALDISFVEHAVVQHIHRFWAWGCFLLSLTEAKYQFLLTGFDLDTHEVYSPIVLDKAPEQHTVTLVYVYGAMHCAILDKQKKKKASMRVYKLGKHASELVKHYPLYSSNGSYALVCSLSILIFLAQFSYFYIHPIHPTFPLWFGLTTLLHCDIILSLPLQYPLANLYPLGTLVFYTLVSYTNFPYHITHLTLTYKIVCS